MNYPKSEKYGTPELLRLIMGPNPVKLEEELLLDNEIPENAVVCDLGSGQGLTSVFLAKEYGFTVYAADLWSEPEEHLAFFDSMGLSRTQIIPVKADAEALPFIRRFSTPSSARTRTTISAATSAIWTKSCSRLLSRADSSISPSQA